MHVRETGLHTERARRRSRYYDAVANHLDEPSKQPQRLRIMEHLLKHHEQRPIKLCSMPGLYWNFERQLIEQTTQPVEFIALDWDWATIERGAAWMPGDKPYYFEEELNIGRIKSFCTSQARWLHTYAGSFFNLEPNDVKDTRSGTKRFNNRYKGLTMVWLDFMGPFSEDVEASLLGLGDFCHRQQAIVPFAITVLFGRDTAELESGGSIDRRIRHVQRLLGKRGRVCFEPSDAWSYYSQDGARMLNITGLLHNVRPELEESEAFTQLSAAA